MLLLVFGRCTQPAAMRRQVEHFTRTGILILHQAKPPRNFAIGFFLSTKIAAKAILVELFAGVDVPQRSEEHTSELPSLMRISYDVFCLQKKKEQRHTPHTAHAGHDIRMIEDRAAKE